MRYSNTTKCFYPDEVEYPSLPDDLIDVPADDLIAVIERDQATETLDVVGGRVVIVPRVFTLDEIKAGKMAELESTYDTVTHVDFVYMGSTFSADETSQQRLVKLSVSLAGGGAIPAGLYWPDVNGVHVSMNKAQFQGLADAMFNTVGWAAFNHLQTKLAAVRTATTVSEVEAITW